MLSYKQKKPLKELQGLFSEVMNILAVADIHGYFKTETHI
jgi:hypothetical protein